MMSVGAQKCGNWASWYDELLAYRLRADSWYIFLVVKRYLYHTQAGVRGKVWNNYNFSYMLPAHDFKNHVISVLQTLHS